jgi:DNA ligase (NAD+)
MLKSIFKEKYSDEYANPRNTAAGKLRDKKNKGEDCKNLHFFAYTMFGPKLNTEAEQFKTLSNLGFDTPNVNVGDIDMMIQTFESINRENIPYEIDGMVIRINDLQHQASMGEKNMRPLGQIAWKFDPATSVSTVVNIKWQVGPSGRVSPVAVVKPINIGGVEITNISLHNLSMFKDLSLYKNCKVLISKRNDLIPFIEKRIDD